MLIVLALGGNALGYDPTEQKKNVKIAAQKIIYLIRRGHRVVITHGNGPQVGLINLAFSEARKLDQTFPEIGFPECGAMSQGYIGYHLQNGINEVLKENDIDYKVATVITQIVVSENDPTFNNPLKPIGKYYSKEDALALEKQNGYVMKDMGIKGYRRVVASPKPIDIVEKDIIEVLLNNNTLVISCGGGGIPVIKKGNSYLGVDAVIDKDYASSLFAQKINADMFVILTDVSYVSLNFGKENQEDLHTLKVIDAYKYISDGCFGEGSMKPKVEAAADFVSKTGNKSLITSLNDLENALNNKVGTIIF